jgi:ABC-type phosphate transport system substrate-binding protein
MRTAIILALALAGSLTAAETAIVNPSVTASVDAEAIKDIYLGRKTTWDGGGKIVVALAESGPSNDALMKLVGKSSSQFATSWKKLVFSGKGVMPEQFANDAAVVEFVAKTPGAIGFVDKAAATDKVKAVSP